MSPAPEPTTASAPPATPAGRRVRHGRSGRLWIVLLLVLATLCGTGAPGPSTGAEPRPAAAPAPEHGGETHDPSAPDTGPPGRARRPHRRVRPPGPAHRRTRAARVHRPAAGGPRPVPVAPRPGTW
ncbi:hypothetical protein [Streptomyces sp. NPDC058855]|uniref:hypothetical protein n=1 Tax=Streptomyces sp. NPDC058855 TaxID=3346651 RepID=UPI00368D1B7E